MARITLRQLLDHAAEHDYGVPAFNINNMEQALAIMATDDHVRAGGKGLPSRVALRQLALGLIGDGASQAGS